LVFRVGGNAFILAGLPLSVVMYILKYMKTISMAEARANLAKLIDSVEFEMERVVINRNGEPAAVLLGIEDYEDLMDELEMLRDPELVKRLSEGKSDADKYLYYTLDDMREILAKKQAGHIFTDEELAADDARVEARNRAGREA
jgi:prevent-host-death family protein